METTTEEPQVHKLVQFRDQEPERMYWKIGQVAIKLGTSATTIRHYQKLGFCRPVIRKIGNRTERLFTSEQIERLRLAKELQGVGIKSKLVKRLMREHRAQYFLDQLNPQAA